MRSELNPAVSHQAGRVRRLTRAAFCAGTLLLLAAQLMAGVKVKVSGSPEKLDLPKDPSREVTPSDSDFLESKFRGGASSQAPVVPLPIQPTPTRNPKLEELLDRKRNWIYENPNSLDRDQALREILGVKNYSFETNDKKPTGMEKYYLDSARESQSSFGPTRSSDRSVNRPNGRYELNPAGRAPGVEDPERQGNSSIIRALDPAPLFNPNIYSDALATGAKADSLNPLFPRGLGEPSFGAKLPGQPAGESPVRQQQDGERPWEIRKMAPGRLLDPINTQPDATRFAIDPITARKASAPPPDSGKSATANAPLFPTSLPMAARSAFSSGFNDQPAASSSFTPPAPAPPSRSMFQPKPAILDIPRPKL